MMSQNCSIPLLLIPYPCSPVAPARAQSELDASVDRLFDEEGSGNEEEPHDSADGDQSAGTLVVSEAAEVVGEDKLRDDYGALGGPSATGKSRSAVQRLLAGAVLNAEVRGGPVPTLPFVTSSVFATPEREDEHLADSVIEAEVDSIVRSAAPIIATVVTATADVTTTTREAPGREALAKPSLFVHCLICRLLLERSGGAEAIHLHAEASRFGVVKKSLHDEVKFLRERNAALEEENGILNVRVTDLATTVKVREQEAADSDALVTAVHALEVSSARLQEKVTTYEKFVDQLKKLPDEHIKDLTIAKYLNSTEYLSALGAEIGKAIEKGMQEGLCTGITHDIEGRDLTDNAAYNPSVEADYLAALHRLQSVQKIRENLANHVSALRNVFIPLSEPLSIAALTGTESTSVVVATPSANVVRPISIYDYEVVQLDGHGGGGTEDQIGGNNVDLFPSVDDADLNLQ
ncbi:hypothetical protein Tco_1028747 [Tanacetum coccineum]|uniref:Uncharacterized protein n=1 Tax=Tanacetum coccineum TaxID=301880 RepID=A0ABQ5G1S8_9ASTR